MAASSRRRVRTAASSGLMLRYRIEVRSAPSVEHARANLKRETKVSDGLSPGGGRHHFFVQISLSIALSSSASANSFFSLAFSSSSALRRLASDTSRPPYLAFHL